MSFQDTGISGSAPSSLWRNHTFTIFLLGQTLSYFGSGMASLVLPLLVLQATGSVARMGQVTALIAVGNLLAGIVTGGVADRYDRRKLLLWSDGISAVLFVSIPVVWALAGPQLLVLLGLAAPIGFCSSATAIGSTASLSRLVDREHFVAANGRLQGSLALGYVAGPLLAGPLAGLWGPVTVLIFNAASYVLSVLSLTVIRLRSPALQQSLLSPRQRRFAAGLWFLLRDPRLRWLMLLRLGVLVVLGGVFDLLAFRLKHELFQSDLIVGLVWGVGSVGAALAGALASPLRRRLGFGGSFLGGLALMGVSLLALGVSAIPLTFVLLGICFTFGDVINQVTSAALVQDLTPDELQGRVAAASQMVLWLGASVGAAAATTIAARLNSTPPVFLGMGALLLLLAVLGLLTPARHNTPERWNEAR